MSSESDALFLSFEERNKRNLNQVALSLTDSITLKGQSLIPVLKDQTHHWAESPLSMSDLSCCLP